MTQTDCETETPNAYTVKLYRFEELQEMKLSAPISTLNWVTPATIPGAAPAYTTVPAGTMPGGSTSHSFTVQRFPLKTVTMRLPVPDLEAAQELASRKRLPYQTYIKMLLHEALEKERRSA